MKEKKKDEPEDQEGNRPSYSLTESSCSRRLEHRDNEGVPMPSSRFQVRVRRHSRIEPNPSTNHQHPDKRGANTHSTHLDPQLDQLQHRVRQVTPQNLWVVLFIEFSLEVSFGVQPKAFSGPCTTCTTCTLLCRGFRYG